MALGVSVTIGLYAQPHTAPLDHDATPSAVYRLAKFAIGQQRFATLFPTIVLLVTLALECLTLLVCSPNHVRSSSVTRTSSSGILALDALVYRKL